MEHVICKSYQVSTWRKNYLWPLFIIASKVQQVLRDSVYISLRIVNISLTMLHRRRTSGEWLY